MSFIKLTSFKDNFFVYVKTDEISGMEAYVPPVSEHIELVDYVGPYVTVMMKQGTGFKVKESADAITKLIDEAEAVDYSYLSKFGLEVDNDSA